MSGAVDVNILIYDVDKGSPFHRKAKEFLNDLFESEKQAVLTWDTLHGFLRAVTHPRVFSTPLSPAEAAAHVQRIVAHPATRMIGPSPESWDILSRLIKDLHLRGPLVSDAVTASVLEANGVRTLYTSDRDFWKFPALKPVDPFK